MQQRCKLFEPLALRGLTLPNRIMVGPMGQYSAKDGSLGAWHLMHLGSLAVSGAGLLIIEATAVNPRARLSPHDPGLWCDANEAALRPILEFCREHGGAHIGSQLFHSGRKGSVTVAWEHQKVIPVKEGGWVPLAPSAIPYPKRTTPKAMDFDDMRAVARDYVTVTQRAQRLGIDLLELHSAHGYLLHNFLSPLTNRREDAYGGSLENRMRFPLEIFKAVREAWPAHKPFGVRISAVDWAEGGWTLPDSVEYAKALKALGCDYITASSGGAVAEQKKRSRAPLPGAVRRDDPARDGHVHCGGRPHHRSAAGRGHPSAGPGRHRRARAHDAVQPALAVARRGRARLRVLLSEAVRARASVDAGRRFPPPVAQRVTVFRFHRSEVPAWHSRPS
jgi:2,4-dienoyl-CoA reductase-like NADH-dependent reductase (Old Yellow Enzyme family)